MLPVKGSGENDRKEESDIFAEETKTFCDCTREISVRWNNKDKHSMALLSSELFSREFTNPAPQRTSDHWKKKKTD